MGAELVANPAMYKRNYTDRDATASYIKLILDIAFGVKCKKQCDLYTRSVVKF